MTRFLKFSLMLVVCFGGLVGGCTRQYVLYRNFDVGCSQHLKRAADANTIELARTELHTAIAYAKEANLTEGNTTIITIWINPHDDIGYWFNNLTASLDVLNSVPNNASPQEKAIVLSRLRTTLLDISQGRECVTQPDGISRFPHNVWWFLFDLLAITWVIVCGLVLMAYIDHLI